LSFMWASELLTAQAANAKERQLSRLQATA
jgi:hypothetical protein